MQKRYFLASAPSSRAFQRMVNTRRTHPSLTAPLLRGYSDCMTRRLLCLLSLLLCLAPTTYAAPPQRIVSLSPGTTEMLFALGLGRSVVGDTVYCDYPPAAKAICQGRRREHQL